MDRTDHFFQADIGMPCHKYILQQLRNKKDALEFTKSFVDTLLHYGTSKENIEATLALLEMKIPPGSPLTGYSFHIWNDIAMPGLSLIDRICLDPDVPTYKRCTQLYRKYDTRYTCCPLCPLSSKYVNGLRVYEQSLLRYVISSKSSLRYCQKAGLTPEHFTFRFDIFEYMVTDKPCLFPIFQYSYSALLNEDICDELYSKDRNITLSEGMKNYLIKSLKSIRLPKKYLQAEWIVKFSDIFSDILLFGNTPSVEEADTALRQLLTPRQKNPGNTTVNIASNVSAPYLQGHFVSRTNYNDSDGIGTDDNAADIKRDDIIQIPFVSPESLQNLAIDLDDENAHVMSIFENHIAKEKILFLEYISSGNSFFIIFWCPGLPRYLFTSGKKPLVNEVIAPMLSHRSIQKICYCPYLLLSHLAYQGLTMRNYYSIFTSYMLLEPGSTRTIQSVLNMYGAKPIIHEWMDKSQFDMLSYISCYQDIKNRTWLLMKQKQLLSDFKEQQLYDTALGISYQLGRYLQKPDVLFRIPKAGTYAFHNEEICCSYTPGELISYEVKRVCNDSIDMIKKVICILVDTERFIISDMKLVGIDSSSFKIFVKTEAYDYITSCINTAFLEIVEANQLYGLEICSYSKKIPMNQIKNEHMH